MKVPLGQGVHEADPNMVENVSLGHGKQLSPLVLPSAYEPGKHSTHAGDCDGEEEEEED